MHVLFAVVDDLLLFAYKAIFGSVTVVKNDSLEDAHVEKHQILEKTDISEQTQVFNEGYQDVPTLQKTKTLTSVHLGDRGYVSALSVQLRTDPVLSFDNTITYVPYGSRVLIMQFQGRWAHIRIGQDVGWILKDSLAMSASEVYPHFVDDQVYTADHVDTVKLRACINDEFGAGVANYPLTSEEYIQYRLTQANRHIPWNSELSRVAGTWQRKLRGNSGVYSAIKPVTESVMEYILDDIGHLAFVESVFPDTSIKITEIGANEDPVFTSRLLTDEQWKELRPVFISIT